MTDQSWIEKLLAEERNNSEWKNLLDSVKTTTKAMSKQEKDYLVDEINFKITGTRHDKVEVLESIQAGTADISDIVGY